MAMLKYRQTLSQGDYVRVFTFAEQHYGMIGRVFLVSDGICGVQIGDEVQVFHVEELHKVHLRYS